MTELFQLLRDMTKIVPYDIISMLFILGFYFFWHKMNKLDKSIGQIFQLYSCHIADSEKTNKELLHRQLRSIYDESWNYINDGKRIPQAVIENFYSSYEIYKKLKGNGYIEHLKEEMDEWCINQNCLFKHD